MRPVLSLWPSPLLVRGPGRPGRIEGPAAVLPETTDVVLKVEKPRALAEAS